LRKNKHPPLERAGVSVEVQQKPRLDRLIFDGAGGGSYLPPLPLNMPQENVAMVRKNRNVWWGKNSAPQPRNADAATSTAIRGARRYIAPSFFLRASYS